jgi:hypothetical protein
MKRTAIALLAVMAAGVSSTCLAQDLKATQKFTDTQIGFDLGYTYSNYTLSITGPNGIQARAASKTSAPSIDLRQVGPLDDGTYNYQLTASTTEKVPVRNRLDNGRGGGPDDSTFRTVSSHGVFQVKGGTIVKFDPNAREDVKRQK